MTWRIEANRSCATFFVLTVLPSTRPMYDTILWPWMLSIVAHLMSGSGGDGGGAHTRPRAKAVQRGANAAVGVRVAQRDRRANIVRVVGGVRAKLVRGGIQPHQV